MAQNVRSVLVDPAVLSVSLEFFTFPDYTTINATNNCLANIESLRGTFPAIRIGGTTQDRATYDPTLATAVNYTVASPLDAPLNLTYGPSFFSLAAQMKGDVTVGLNRQLNNMSNSLSAALQAEKTMENLLSIEFGNEPDLYSQSSPIVPAGSTWSPPVDGAVQKQWISSMASSLGGIFQAAVYLSYPKWSTQGLIPILNTTVEYVKTFSGHSYPQSACGGATTNLPALMNHSAIVSYTSQYKPEASAAHGVGKRYFLGETNSATCGGGGISPTFGAALWVMDYVLQGALNGVDRLYFHQGTIGNCQYCFWGRTTVEAPYYGAAFVSEFLGTGGVKLAMLDDGSGAVGSYAVYSQDTNRPVRLLVYNSNYYNGTGTRTVSTITFTGISGGQTGSVIVAKRLTASNANVTIDAGGEVTIGGGGMFDENCLPTGVQSLEGVSVGSGGTISVSVNASEALIVYL
ncbi:glycoside hydrolase family 79 protein [Jaapia argillacea MUCL 33604]|uniref:Glycoside hydrolase family 79 protein n=1 Tax=Jaapia argillacea MUCL 33604 TaxID=933084 RepID=A0A067P469_9AGAM|nr:glycoside hydrolase family 79 protein [Jaapia argillacea MUCL 33604]